MALESHGHLVCFSLQDFESKCPDRFLLSEVLLVLLYEIHQQETDLQWVENHYRAACRNVGTKHRGQASEGGHKWPNIIQLNKGDRDLLLGGVWAVGG